MKNRRFARDGHALAVAALVLVASCEDKAGVSALGEATDKETACDSDKDCADSDEVCDMDQRICVGCLTQADCQDDEICRSASCEQVTDCDSSKDCADNEVCDTGLGYCVECVADADCEDGSICVESACRPSCDSDNDCSDTDQVCDKTLSACVDCVTAADCEDAQHCRDSLCVADVCEPEDSSCEGTEMLVCNDDGSGFDALTCAEGCDDEGQACEGDATPIDPTLMASESSSVPEPDADPSSLATSMEPLPDGSGGSSTPITSETSMGGAAPTQTPTASGGSMNSGGTSAGGMSGAGGSTPGCEALGCEVPVCGAGATTSISGKVTAPNGTLPIYNALVYVPAGQVLPSAAGAACDPCGVPPSGSPLAVGLTDAQGNFHLEGVPAGEVPLVIQLGKWRRYTTVTTTECADNPVDIESTRLPRNQLEGELPRIAITTGGSDALECIPLRLGIDPSEFTLDSGTGSVHLYQGGAVGGDGAGTGSFQAGGTFPLATSSLWPSVDKMLGYDMMIMSCEGSSLVEAKELYYGNVFNYAAQGGRILLNHMHFTWLREGPLGFSDTANFIGVGDDLVEPSVGIINTSFPKGQAMADWLFATGASPVPGQLEIWGGQYSVNGVVAPTASWIEVAGVETSTQYMSFNAPRDAAPGAECGRVVFADLHVNTAVGATGGDDSDPTKPFPTGCVDTAWSPQALATAFAMLDLLGCVQADLATPTAPALP